jgi:hypothetical protein
VYISIIIALMMVLTIPTVPTVLASDDYFGMSNLSQYANHRQVDCDANPASFL